MRNGVNKRWTRTTIGEAFIVNPFRPLKKGVTTPFIPMDALPANERSAERIETRAFTGSGSRFKNGDTLIARITPCLENGKTAYVSCLNDGIIAHGSTEYIVLGTRRGVTDGLFGYYLSRTPNFRKYTIGHMEGTSGRQRVPANAVENYQIELPSLNEQRSIAQILGTLDDKIELNRKTNETLESMARTLFQAWFVDFEPVRAKMEGRWKRGQSLPCLPAHLYDLFPDRLVGSDERESPDGWIFGQLSSICNLNPESWTKRNRPQSIHYIDLSSTKLGRIEQISEYKIDNAPSRAQRILLKNDTILGTVRPENCSYALVHDNGLTGSTGFAVLRPKKPIYTEIVYLSATSQSNIDRLSALADGAAYPAVRPEVVLETIIPQIPDELIIEFSKTTNPLLTSIAENEKMSRTLSQLRDTLLPRLMSGELRIPDAERIAGEAL